MSTPTPLPAFASRSFQVEYPGLVAHNIYSADGRRVSYAIVPALTLAPAAKPNASGSRLPKGST
ncbi:hypothetical protein D3C77_605680 [compost metagenome]